MIFGLPTWLFVVFIFLILIITILAITVIYFVFFRKVQVIVFGANGMPPEIRQAKKKEERLWFSSTINMSIYKNYISYGKKKVYFAVKLDEKTYIPYNLVDKKEVIEELDNKIDEKIINAQIDEISKSNVSKKQKELIDKIQALKSKIELVNDRIYTIQNRIQLGEERYWLIFSLDKALKRANEQKTILDKSLNRLLDTKKVYEDIETKKLKTVYDSKPKKKVWGIMPFLDVDYDWLSAVSDAYEIGATRFKFGWDKFAPYITVAIVVIMCIIGTIVSVKYNTEMTPVEAEAYKEFGESLKVCAQYNVAYAQALNVSPNTKQEGFNIPR